MIELKGIWKRYKDEDLFKDFNMSFPEGEVSVLIGPSGCGKTTLLRMIAGLEPFDQGSITGVDERRIAFVFQEDRLLPWLTAGENIELVLKADMDHAAAWAKIREVLLIVNLPRAEKMMPDELSGGMKRRIAIARALAYDGDIVLLDEPFKGMDEALKADVLPRLGKIWRSSGKTVILVTHDTSEAKHLADHLFELKTKACEGHHRVRRVMTATGDGWHGT